MHNSRKEYFFKTIKSADTGPHDTTPFSTEYWKNDYLSCLKTVDYYSEGISSIAMSNASILRLQFMITDC
jgi:hypothetical protein